MNEQTLLDRFNRWIQESIAVKLFSIGFLLLLLLIPLSWVNDLIEERQQRADSVQADITDKWSGRQTLTGPVVVIPYTRIEVIKNKDEEPETIEVPERLFLAPSTLDVKGTVDPQILHRGIFEAAVYSSSLQLSSSFVSPDLKELEIDPQRIKWKDVHVVFGINDLRGVSENPIIKYGSRELMVEPSSEIGFTYGERSQTGLTAKLDVTTLQEISQDLSIRLTLKGSQSLDFTPIAKTTDVNLSGPWQDPSFSGEFLPQSREINQEGFKSTWRVLHFNRPFVQQWKEGRKDISGSDFGVNLLIPVEQYQKSMRTSKYGFMIILLTFVSLFLVEISLKVRIHPIQYTLIGAALIIYYALLLSFSEQMGYNFSYWLAGLATVALITLYSRSFLPTTQSIVLFMGVLLASYTFIFVIIIQQDFSLLIGSIGLFITVAVLMFITRKIRWYQYAANNES